MDKIFDPFGYGNLLKVEDGSGKRIEGSLTIIAQISYDPASIRAIADEVY